MFASRTINSSFEGQSTECLINSVTIIEGMLRENVSVELLKSTLTVLGHEILDRAIEHKDELAVKFLKDRLE
jgi:hypothetical protein